jgi:hypothetical protein
MNDGVKILLERMKTHPEEFAGDREGKWSHLIQSYRMFLAVDDWQALEKSMNALMQQRFTEKVLEKLVNPDRKLTREEKIPFRGKIPTIPSITIEQTEHLRARLDALAVGQTPIAGVTQTL